MFILLSSLFGNEALFDVLCEQQITDKNWSFLSFVAGCKMANAFDAIS